jgi:hypothetical protein
MKEYPTGSVRDSFGANPIWLAMARALSGWSLVIMTVRTPAWWHL